MESRDHSKDRRKRIIRCNVCGFLLAMASFVVFLVWLWGIALSLGFGK